jgi:hypothetical protein
MLSPDTIRRMGKPSEELFIAHMKAAEAFDYFVCGVAGAMFAYITKDYAPEKLALSFSLLTPLSLILLAGSLFSGLKRLEAAVTAKVANGKMLHAAEGVGEITCKLVTPQGGALVNTATGDIHTPAELLARRDELRIECAQYKRECERWSGIGSSWYKWRDWLLIAGFAAIFLAKVAQPYAQKTAIANSAPLSISAPASK